MSWFLGGIGNFNEEFLSTIKHLTPTPLIQSLSDSMFLIAGGIPNTCKFKLDDTTHVKNWLQVGIGISQGSPHKFLSTDDWNRIVSNDTEDRVELDGHYVLLSWNLDRIIFVTDKLGLRDFYYCTDAKGNIFFSTRIDWLAKLIPTQIDFEEFGGKWLLFTQISSGSILKNIHRVVSGSSLSISRKTKQVLHKDFNWLPSISAKTYSEKEFSDELEDLITFPMRENKLSLSLSGGLDSRVILSYLIRHKENWDTHSFGSVEHPDFIVAKKMATDLGIVHRHIEAPPISIDEFIATLKDYVGQTVINTAASSLLQLGNYKLLQDSREIIIDGGFGELWRRQYLNRLSFFGQKYILRRDYKNIVKLISLHRADIFNEDINRKMRTGCEEQISKIFELLPSPETIGVNNWIDLFAIKTRLPNYFLHEQSRTDSIVLSYMPFTQLSILNKLFSLDSSLKTNAKMLKRIIGANAPLLKKFPLVKGDIQHPYLMNSFQTRILTRVLKFTNRNKTKNWFDLSVIKNLSTMLSDTLHSKSVTENNIYDSKKLKTMFDSISGENNEQRSVGELDWWLAFEMFRRQINKSDGFE
ncbi:hypothetical protein C0389_03055 [bacterium]|nr:hypothetical protein [bacterium]